MFWITFACFVLYLCSWWGYVWYHQLLYGYYFSLEEYFRIHLWRLHLVFNSLWIVAITWQIMTYATGDKLFLHRYPQEHHFLTDPINLVYYYSSVPNSYPLNVFVIYTRTSMHEIFILSSTVSPWIFLFFILLRFILDLVWKQPPSE